MKPRKSKDNVITLRVDDDMYRRIKDLSEADSRSDSAIVRLCLERFLPELEAKAGLIAAPEIECAKAMSETEHARKLKKEKE